MMMMRSRLMAWRGVAWRGLMLRPDGVSGDVMLFVRE